MGSNIGSRWAPLLVVACAAGCVVVPYQPSAEVTQTHDVVVDPRSVIVTAGPRERLEDLAQAITDEDRAIKIVPSQDFLDVAFVDQDMTLTRLLDPATCSRIFTELQTDFAVLLAESQLYSTDEHGGMAADAYGAKSMKEHRVERATVIDLRNAKLLGETSAHAHGTSAGAAVIPLVVAVVPLTESSARRGLASGVVAAMREAAGPGPLKIAVLAAERGSSAVVSP